MSDLLAFAGLAIVVVIVQAAVIRHLLTSNRALIRAVVSKNSQELISLEHAAAQSEPARFTLPKRSMPSIDNDEWEPTPLGLSG